MSTILTLIYCTPTLPYCCITSSVAEPKLFVLAPALAPTFKKFPLRLLLRLKLCGYLFSQLLNEKVDFSWLLGKNINLIHFFDPINMNYDLIHYFRLPRAAAGSRSQNFSTLAPAPAKSFSSLLLLLWLQLHNTDYFWDFYFVTELFQKHNKRLPLLLCF